jgi:hypothetical protein
MQKLSAWLFLLIALIWLLPLVGLVGLNTTLDVATSWIQVISLALIAILELRK